MSFFDKFIKFIKGDTIYIGGVGTRSSSRPIDIEHQEMCSAIIDCNATHIARGQVLHVIKDKDGRIKSTRRDSEYTRLFNHPNQYMTRQDFMYSMAWQLQLTNIALAWIKWEGIHPVEIYPLMYLGFEVRERKSGGYAIQFYDLDGYQHTLALEDLIVLRRKYSGIGYVGQDNSAIKPTLEMVESLDDALRQASKISNKINGILKQKNAMLAPERNKEEGNNFYSRVKYASENGGILALDATEEYSPMSVNTWTANAAQLQQINDRLYTFWRTPIEVVKNTASEQVMQNYYDSIIESCWDEMGEAFTNALFTRKEQGFGNSMIVTSGVATGASWQTKLNIIANCKETGLLTINEQRELLGYSPVEDGDDRLVSLNYIKSTDQSKYQTGEETVQPTQEETSKEGGENNAE